MKPLTERILKLAVCEDITYTQAIKKDPSLVDSSKNEILNFFAGEEKENTRLLPLIRSLAEIIEKQSEALEPFVDTYEALFRAYKLEPSLTPEDWDDEKLAYEAAEFTQARLKELGCGDE